MAVAIRHGIGAVRWGGELLFRRAGSWPQPEVSQSARSPDYGWPPMSYRSPGTERGCSGIEAVRAREPKVNELKAEN